MGFTPMDRLFSLSEVHRNNGQNNNHPNLQNVMGYLIQAHDN